MDFHNVVAFLFLLVFFATIYLFYQANGKPKKLFTIIMFWSLVHAMLAHKGFYQVYTGFPRFALVLLPATAAIIYGLLPQHRNWLYTNRNTTVSTLIHCIRAGVEFILLYLFINKMVPQIMTFEGYNFDILAGISAPIIALLYTKNKLSKQGLIYWNILGLVLILTIFIMGILSGPLPFQQFAFDQPNIAISYFPYVLLPATIVPIVIYSHISDILVLRKAIQSNVK